MAEDWILIFHANLPPLFPTRVKLCAVLDFYWVWKWSRGLLGINVCTKRCGFWLKFTLKERSLTVKSVCYVLDAIANQPYSKKNLSPSATQSNQCLFLICPLFIVEAKRPVPAVTVLPKLMPLWCALDHNTSRISFFVLSHGEYDPTERDSVRLLRYCLRRTSYCRTWWQFLSMAQAFLLLSHPEQKKNRRFQWMRIPTKNMT